MSVETEQPMVPDLGLPVIGGALVVVVGPSGAGKDTLLNYARQVLAEDDRVFFVRRVITRPADGETERHLAATRAEFEAMKASGRFAFTWQAHELEYGLPASIDDNIRSGQTAVCNGSRAALAGLRARYVNFSVISITAHREVLANRLAARGRESRQQILARLDRSAHFDAAHYDALQIDNSGPVTVAGDALVAAIKAVGWRD
ncbi:MAG: phosphonate metabolism protein/1,5-bisphosphokinase (PRPP-forming) PhnN [Alphaproteobacteria bacterium]|nr:phosphonate metabolism protein/1,5-bisphosphokinase (PRPP-forming) PhnN [Alphaproteobacteria bacterium]